MSCFLFGDLISFTTKPSFEEACEIAKELLRQGDGSYYVKFGGNVSNQYIATFPDEIAGNWHLPYEITDSILENTADCLVSPKAYADGRTWNARKASIISFVQTALAISGIDGVTLNLNMERTLLSDPFLKHFCSIESLADLLETVFSENRPYLDPTARIWISSAESLVNPEPTSIKSAGM